MIYNLFLKDNSSIQIMYVEMVNAQDKIPTRNGLRGIFIHLVR